MNIIKFRTNLIIGDNIRYVGRLKNAGHIGLGNPWSSSSSPNAYYWVKTKKEALDKYRIWVKQLFDVFKHGDIYALPFNERIYLIKMIALAIDIRNKKVNTLVCHCINAGNYQPVGDGMEQCHAEILYKACLEIQRYLQERRDKEASLCLDEIR